MTNLGFIEWVQLFGDEKLTTALLDQLAHDADVLMTKSHRIIAPPRRAAMVSKQAV